MKIIIAAGTGFLGKNLETYFTDKGHEVIILSRNPHRSNEYHWDVNTLGKWKNLFENADVLINLAGKSGKPWDIGPIKFDKLRQIKDVIIDLQNSFVHMIFHISIVVIRDFCS